MTGKDNKFVCTNLTEGSISRNIWRLALPMMGGAILQNLFNIVDMIFVGRLGPAAVGAVAMAGVLIGIPMMLMMGISAGSIALISRFWGAGKKEDAETVAMQSLLLAILVSVIIAISGYLFAVPLLRILGAKQEMVALGKPYIQILSLGCFFMFFSLSLNSALQGAGDVLTPLKIMALGTILNIILDPILIFGLLGFPRMGVAGSAFATVIARGIGVIVLFWLLFRGHTFLWLDLRKLKPDLDIIWRMVRIGFFASVEVFLRETSMLILMRIVAIYGTFAVAAYGIGTRVRMLAMMPGFGLARAASTLVGQNLGAGKPQRAQKSAWLACGFYEIIMCSLGVVFFVLANGIIKIFNAHPEVVQIGTSYLRYFSPALVFMGAAIVLSQALSGAGDTKSPMVITGIALLGVRIPLALIFSQTLNLGTNGIWLAMLGSQVLGGILMMLKFVEGRWQHKRV